MVLTDNFGLFLAGMFRQPTTANSGVVVGFRDITGAIFSAKIYHSESDGNVANATANNTIQIGKGNSTPTRQDNTIESPFTNGGIEDSPVLSQADYGYINGSGLATKETIISPTFASGTIKEEVKFCTMDGKICIWSRNLVGDVVFIGGDSINVSNEVSI